MNPNKQIVVRWSLSMIPVYDNLHEQISRPLVLTDGIVGLDESDLVKISFEGKIIWRCSHEWGFWGSPVKVDADRIVCASINNQLHSIDRAGKIVRTTELPTSVSTEILVGEKGDLWFGIGAYECAVTRICPNGSIIYTEYVARDKGLRQPLTWGVDGSLWAATDQSLARLDAQSGKILTWISGEWDGFGCFSEAMPLADGALVVAALPEQQCAVVKVANNGKILAQYPLPNLLRARLVANPTGGAWAIGSTVSPWEPVSDEDRTFVVRLTPDGKPEAVTEAPARRFIEATVNSDGTLWVGTYTRNDEDDSEIGELTTYKGAAIPSAKWIPTPPAGVGAPVLSPDGKGGVVATSTALVGFTPTAPHG